MEHHGQQACQGAVDPALVQDPVQLLAAPPPPQPSFGTVDRAPPDTWSTVRWQSMVLDL